MAELYNARRAHRCPAWLVNPCSRWHKRAHWLYGALRSSEVRRVRDMGEAGGGRLSALHAGKGPADGAGARRHRACGDRYDADGGCEPAGRSCVFARLRRCRTGGCSRSRGGRHGFAFGHHDRPLRLLAHDRERARESGQHHVCRHQRRQSALVLRWYPRGWQRRLRKDDQPLRRRGKWAAFRYRGARARP